MNLTIVLLIVFVIAVIVGPFATLYAVTSYRRRRGAAPSPRRPAADDDDESSGF
jgi:heme/copper-type cytochrome/quinol oxidase subunit 2